MLFLPNWSTARGIYLLISVVPFFTIAGLEHVSKIILTDVTLPMKVMKYTAVLFISALLVSIEYLITGLVIDAFSSKKAKKNTFVPVFEVNDEGNPIPEEILKNTNKSETKDNEENEKSEDFVETIDEENPDFDGEKSSKENIKEIDISDIDMEDKNFTPVKKEEPVETFYETENSVFDEEIPDLKQPDTLSRSQVDELSSIVPGFSDNDEVSEEKESEPLSEVETIVENKVEMQKPEPKAVPVVESKVETRKPEFSQINRVEEDIDDFDSFEIPELMDISEIEELTKEEEIEEQKEAEVVSASIVEEHTDQTETNSYIEETVPEKGDMDAPLNVENKASKIVEEPIILSTKVEPEKKENEIITIDFDAGRKPEPQVITLNFNSENAPELKLLKEDEPEIISGHKLEEYGKRQEQNVSSEMMDTPKSQVVAEKPSATNVNASVVDNNVEKKSENLQEEIDLEAELPIGAGAEAFYSSEEEAFFLDPFAEEASAESEADAEPEITEKAYVPENVSTDTKYSGYNIPTEGLLNSFENNPYWIIDDETRQAGSVLKETLSEFKIEAEITGIRKGPVITMFEILPAPGVRLNKIVALQDNIALRLAAASVRIVAPIPGKQAVGVEIPNRERAMVSFRELIEKDLPAFTKMQIPVVLGKDITGDAQMLDLTATPHLLIAGSTGSGKSVCVNSIILSILYKRSPRDVKMILIDPKVVELKLYNDIPHLLTPVITEPKKAFQALQYCLCEMERRYAMLDRMGVRDIKTYNRRIAERQVMQEKLPYIVVIIDEFADLMATTGKELENTVARLAAMSRAVGIHLVLATQRPSIDVITGLIKANIPTRIAFMVASKTDSRIIIDQMGAEKLLGKGDMLYASAIDPFPVRIQGTFVTEDEVENVVDYVKQFGPPDYIDDEIFVDDDEDEGETQSETLFTEGEDPLYEQALDIVVQAGKASASYIQRRLKIGYNRAARLVEEMEDRGIVGPANGAKPRELIHIP